MRAVETITTRPQEAEPVADGTSDRVRPMIACVMLSGGTPERQCLAVEAVDDFLRQTYDNRILIVVDSHETSLVERCPAEEIVSDPRIFVVRMAPQVLGTLRNYGLLHARRRKADLFVAWDDDDRRAPELIETQLRDTPSGCASVLRRQTFRRTGKPDVVCEYRGSKYVPGFPGTLMAPLGFPLWYPNLPCREDTAFVRALWRFTRVVAVDADATMYVRRIHGANVCPPEHFQRMLDGPTDGEPSGESASSLRKARTRASRRLRR